MTTRLLSVLATPDQWAEGCHCSFLANRKRSSMPLSKMRRLPAMLASLPFGGGERWCCHSDHFTLTSLSLSSRGQGHCGGNSSFCSRLPAVAGPQLAPGVWPRVPRRAAGRDGCGGRGRGRMGGGEHRGIPARPGLVHPHLGFCGAEM